LTDITSGFFINTNEVPVLEIDVFIELYLAAGTPRLTRDLRNIFEFEEGIWVAFLPLQIVIWGIVVHIAGYYQNA